MYENEPNMTFLTLAMAFRMIQSNPSQFVVTILGKFHAKIEEKLLTDFE